MTLTIGTLADVRGDEARARWLHAFVGAPSALRSGAHAAHAPGEAYSGLVLRLASQRPHQLVVAADGDRLRGRLLIAASHATASSAALGLFEVAPGPDALEIARQMVREAEAWATEHGRAEIYAPVDLNSWFSYRFPLPAISSDAPEPYAWEPTAPPEYLQLFRQLGYADAEYYHTIGATLSTAGYTAHDAARSTLPAFEQALAAGYRPERLESTAHLDALLGEMHALCMAAFGDNPLFEPLPLELFRVMYASAAASYDCSLSHWLRDARGALVGFVLAFVDAGAVVVKTIAVVPELRGQRLSSALMHLVLRTAAERSHASFVSALVRRGNTSEFLSQAHLVPGLRSWRREYVLLVKRLGAASEGPLP